MFKDLVKEHNRMEIVQKEQRKENMHRIKVLALTVLTLMAVSVAKSSYNPYQNLELMGIRQDSSGIDMKNGKVIYNMYTIYEYKDKVTGTIIDSTKKLVK